MRPFRYLSVCSGMEAATLAFGPLGWQPLACAEIEKAPRALIAQRLPNTPLYGDFTLLRDMLELIVNADMLIGGTPCQGFSVAGLRGSLSDDRSNLCLEFVRLANAIDDLRRDAGREPCWITWENVPGVLSTPDNAFGTFLGGLVGSDAPLVSKGGWQYAGVVDGPRRCAAWRTLDAQHFGLAQRRLRVFVLAIEHPRGWSAPDALLPITESMRWHPAPSRETGERAAPTIAARTRGGGGLGTDTECDGALIPLTDPNSHVIQTHWAVRRLTPKECERLQGAPDDWTNIAYRGRNTIADGPRYKMIGNSWAVPCVRYIGERIAAVMAEWERAA